MPSAFSRRLVGTLFAVFASTLVADSALAQNNILTIGDRFANETNAGTTIFSFAVTLQRIECGVKTVQFATANGSALAGSDYVASSGTLTFPDPGGACPDQVLNINITVNGDTTIEASETFFVNLSNAPTVFIQDGQGLGTIINDDNGLSVADISINEGDAGNTNAVFTVLLTRATGGCNTTVTVNYATSDMTAIAPGDYLQRTGSLSFPPPAVACINQTLQVAVPVVGDTAIEPDESFFLNLSGATNAVITDNAGMATILNDDRSITIDDVSVSEANSGQTTTLIFTVTVNPPPTSITTVDVATANGTAVAPGDYATAGTTLQITGPSAQFAVTVNGDNLDELNETVLVNLTNASGGQITDAQGVGTILDNDAPPSISIIDRTVTENDTPGTVNAVFTIDLTIPSTLPISVDFATANGTAVAPGDYVAQSGTANFVPGARSASVVVVVNGDLLDEDDETFTVGLSNPSNATIGDATGLGTILDNDPIPTLSIADVAAFTEGNGGTTNMVFTVTLTPVSGRLVTVDYSTSNGTALAGSDYNSVSGTLSFAAGVTTRQILVPITGDLADEPNETLFVDLINPINAALPDRQAQGTIVDDDPQPTLSINDVTVTEGNAGTVIANFTVTLSAASGFAVNVNYATSDGSAVNPQDYVTTSGNLAFAAGVTTRQVMVTVNGDTLDEANESFSVTLSAAVNAGISDALGAGTITDDDNPPTVSINDVTVAEGNGGGVSASFTLTLSAVSGQAINVSFATADVTATAGADYTSGAGTRLFNPGVLTQTVVITVTGDVLDEINETYAVNLNTPVNVTIADGQGIGTITDDDAPPAISINDINVAEGNAGTTIGAFTVTLSAPSGQQVSVDYASANGTALAGTDYVAGSGTVIFTAGQTTRPVNVTVNGDTLDELNETFVVNLTNGVNASLADPQGQGTITDDDAPPALSINDVSVTEGNTGTANLGFSVTLSAASGLQVTVDWATGNGSAAPGADYVVASANLVFAPGVTTMPVNVVVNGDLLDEANETVPVILSNAINATILDNQGTGTITDDDNPPTISITNLTVAEGNAGGTNASFTVTLSAPSGLAVSVDFAAANGTAVSPADYNATSGTVNFVAGDTSEPLVVVVNGDLLDEVNETYVVNLTNPVNATILDNQGAGTITDDDNPPAMSINDVSVIEGDAGAVVASFTVTLTAPSGQAVGVDFATANGTALAPSDYLTTSGNVSFTPGQVTRVIAVTVNGDTLSEVNETYFVNLTNPSNATLTDTQGQGTITDDDAAPSLFINDVTVTEGNAGTINAGFTVSLSAASGQVVSVDWATADGSASAGPDYNSGGASLLFMPGTVTQPVTVVVSGDVLDEINETFFVNLTNAMNAPIIDPQGIGTITDDDNPPALSINDVVVTEGNAGTVNAGFTVTLSAASGQQVSVDFTTANGSATSGTDYVFSSGNLVFNAGVLTRPVTVVVSGDTLDEINETYLVNLSNALNATIQDPQGLGTITDDDAPPSLSMNNVSVTEGNAGTVNANFTVTLSAASGQLVTVSYATANGTAIAPFDYATDTGNLSFAPGVTTQPVVVTVSGDLLDEPNETFVVSLLNEVNATIGAGAGTGTINDDDNPPTVSINDVAVTEGNAGTVNANFAVTLSAPSGQAVTLNWATANGTALAGSDYAGASGALTFLAGVTTQPVVVQVNGDLLDEVNEAFVVNLTNPINVTIADGQGTGTITDDDAAPAMAINDVTVTEGNAGTINASFVVTLSAPSGQQVSASFATANQTATAGADYVLQNGSVVFTAGEISRPVVIQVNGDLLDEIDETFFVNLSGEVNATLADPQGLGTIQDDDAPPTMTINDVTVLEGNAGTINAAFTVTLSAASGQPISVDFATGDVTASAGSDYVGLAGNLSFAPGVTTRPVTIVVNADLLDEINETFNVGLSNEVNATIADGQGVGTITDDDAPPALTINNVTVTEGNAGTINANFTVTLSAASGQMVSVDFGTANGTAVAGPDYAVQNGNLVFLPGTTSQPIQVVVNADLLDEPNETFFVNLTNSINASIGDPQGLGTITDDDAPPSMSIDDVSVSEGDAGTVNMSFTVTLSALSGQQVTADFATANLTATSGADYVAQNGALTFAAGVTSQPIVIQVNGDVLDESNETFNVNLTNLVNATVGDAAGLGTITDDDAAPALSLNSVSVVEGNAGTVNAGFTASLSQASGQIVTVNFATSNGSAVAGTDYVAQTGSLTFTAGVLTQPVVIVVNGDVLNEANEAFNVNLNTPVNAVLGGATGIGTILDDDAAPSLSISDVSVTEGNAGTVNANFTVNLSAVSGQQVDVDFATSDDTATAGVDYVAQNGSLSFPAGVTSRPVTIVVSGDLLDELNEGFFVTLSNAMNAPIIDGQGVGTITDDDTPPSASIGNVTVAEGNAGTVNAGFTITLSAASGQLVTVSWATADDTAAAGADYVNASGVVSFTAGTISQPVTVVVNGDLLDEINEAFLVNLSNPVNATLGTSLGTGTITDDDAPPSLAINDVTVTEGNAGTVNANFTVTLSALSGQLVMVDFATANGTALAGSDYALLTGSTSFAPGVLTRPITVVVNGDLTDEPNETFFVNLTNPVNATLGDNQGSGSITDDDAPAALSINDVTVAEGNAGTTNASFTVTLSAVSGQTVSVDFGSANGSATAPADYLAAAGNLSFAPGVTSQPVTVVVNGDLTDEINETFLVSLTNPSNATLSDNQGSGTITDDDAPPSVAINDLTVTEGNAGTVNASFTVTLAAASGQQVTVDFASANGTATSGTDYTAAAGNLVFAPGVTTQPALVVVNADLLDEINETFVVNLTNPVNASLGDDQGTGTITDDDAQPTLAINDVTVTEGNAGTVNANFTVTLSAASGQQITVDFASANGTAISGADYVAQTGSLVFAPGATTSPVVIVVNGDALDEADETFTVNLSNPASATILDAVGAGTITDDDAAPSIAINDATVAEGNAGTILAAFTVSLSAASGRAITVDFATANGTALAGSDYVAQNASLSFAPGVTTRPVNVVVNGDTLDELNETFNVNLSNPTNATLADALGLGTITDDDAAPSIAIGDVTLAEGNAGTVNANFTVTLSAASGQLINVDFTTANGSATAGSDYVAESGNLSFTPGTLTQPISVAINGDTGDEPNETFLVNLSNAINAAIGDNQAIGTITDDDAPPVIAINDVSATEGNAGTVNLSFNVTLSVASGQQVSVDFASANGSASAGSDYVSVLGNLIFAPGVVTLPVVVQVSGDLLDEANETFTVNLTAPINASIGDSSGTGTITDDDAPPTLSINDASVVEGNAGTINANFTVTLSAASGQPVSVNFTTANGTATAGSDFVAQSGVLTFAPGMLTRPIAIVVNGDVLNETNEAYAVTLSAPVNATIVDGSGAGAIVDDDAAPSLSINDVTVAEGNAGTVNASFTVTLSAPSALMVSVDFTTADATATQGADYVAQTNTLSFAPGVTTRPVTVAVNGDLLDEANETFLLNLSNASNAPIIDPQGVATITDDDAPPSASIGSIAVTEGNAGSSNASLTVTLSAPSGQVVTFNWATADVSATAGSDYQSAFGVVTFAPGATSQPVVVPVLGDTLDEGNESFVVNLTNPVNATIADAQATATINDDDGAPVLSVNDLTVAEGNAGTVNATFLVTLSAVSGTQITVAWATANQTATSGSDYVAASGTLTFAPGVVSQPVVVLVNGDVTDEPNETFTLDLSNPVNTALADGQGIATITDDDGAPAISIADLSVSEGNAGTVDAIFTVSLAAASGQQVTVNWVTADGSATAGADYVAGSGLVTFAPGTLSQSLTVVVNGDTLDEPNETFTINLTNPVNAPIGDGQATGTITDDDGSPALAVADLTVTEGDSGTVNANFSVTLSAASGQPVSVEFATADGTATAGTDYLAAAGSLSFAPGVLSQPVSVTINVDLLDELDETLSLTLSNPVGALIAQAQATATILDDDAAPAISLTDLTVIEGNAGTTAASFTVSLSAVSGLEVRVDYATLDGSATAGTDYVPGSGTLTFPPGTITQPIDLSVLGDNLDEPEETVLVELTNVMNATISDGSAELTISDDDNAPDLRLAVSHTGDFTVGELGRYTLSVANIGGGATLGSITVTDVLPAGLGFSSAQGTGWACTESTGQLVCTSQDVVASMAAAPDIELDVLVGPAAFPTVTHSATVAVAGDFDPSNDSATDPTRVIGSADLSVAKTRPGQGPATPGEAIVYTITVTNLGPSPIDELFVVDQLPATISLASFVPNIGTYSDQDGLWTGLTLSTNQSATLEVSGTLSAEASGTVSNTALVSVANGYVDPNPANDSSTEVSSITEPGACDQDGLSDELERMLGTDPCKPDTDGDGLCDGADSVEGVCIAGEDLNANGTRDPNETDATNKDSDGDSLSDGLEVTAKNPTNPINADSDDDGLCDGANSVDTVCVAGEDRNGNGEVDRNETDPNDPDTDHGGVSDGEEQEAGTDPLSQADDLGSDCDCNSVRMNRGPPFGLALLLLLAGALIVRRRPL